MIRKGVSQDLPQVFELIRELAVYEKAEDQVVVDVDYMKSCFEKENPDFDFFVCEDASSQKIVGIALFYMRYSTWKGRRLYLEDLIVTKSARGKGYGKSLLDRLVEYARETQCSGLMWQVLDWNTPSIEFYKKCFDARLDSEWINCHIDF